MSRDDPGSAPGGHVTSDITITVTGGVGRMDADATDMALAAGLVSTAAGRLATARVRCHQMLARIANLEALAVLGWGSLGAEPDSGAAIHLDQAQTSLRLAATALALQTADLEELASSTFGAADRYSEAEAQAERGLLDVAGGISSWLVLSPFGFQRAFGLAGSMGAGALQSSGTSWRDRLAGSAAGGLGALNPRRDPFSTPGVDDAALVIGAGYLRLGRGTDPAARGLRSLMGLPSTPGAALDYRPGHLTQTTKTVAPITSALDAADAVADLPDRSVSVLRTTHPGGIDTWAVFVRGTDDWDPGSVSPFSGEANFVLMGGGDADSTTLVESALQQAGVPVGAAVGIYGHSQGGIVAMRLADDPVFRRRYDLRSVTTFGSPTATITPASPVPTLHVENNQEWVSSADASVARGTPDRVTVSADLAAGHGSPHSMSTHREVLAAAIGQGDPSVLHAVAQQEAVLGGPAFAGSTTLPLPDVQITVFSPGPPAPTSPPPTSPPPAMFTAAPTLPGLRPPADLLVTPEVPRAVDGQVDWDELSRRAQPGLGHR